ncbi:MAG: ChaN family lipoprotein [Amaricoccus sp.]|uniref:ChaN family lipoprotein n=1 Tax=Amaricoccus sp. TaxID=1872485 RepID=UPI0039E58ECE
MQRVRIAALACALLLPGAASPSSLAEVVAGAKGADIVVVGEVHDNPAHHDNQAAVVAALQPDALVFEMIPQTAEDEVNDLRTHGAGPGQIAAALRWDQSGWPDFAFYAAILTAAPNARVFGAEQSQADVKRAMVEGAAGVFGPDASTYGLDKPLPTPEQLRREAEQAAAHCGALPAEMLPRMVEAQRLRDAEIADAALWARTMTGDGKVVVIAGSGHASRRRGAPALLALAAPELKVFAVGQFETPPDDAADYDAVLLAPVVPRGDPCAGLTPGEP